MRRSTAAWAVLALVVSVTTACGGAEEGSKAGGDAVPVTLRIGTDDGPGRPAADQIHEFARQVDAMSAGQITIEPVWNADGQGQRDWDQRVARMVVSGELEMGLIPSRAWDTEGVTSLRALNAPFLVTSEELMAEVVSAQVATDMLAGLDTVGITGLALLPEAMRQVFSFGEPLLTPEQFQGVTIRAPRSDTTYALFQALGATVNDVQGDEFSAGVHDGTVAGAESSFAFAVSLPRPAVATGNLNLFPKVNSLVVNSDSFAGLTEAQQGILRQAADATRQWAIGAVIDSPTAATGYCSDGGTVVVTTTENVAAFEKATQPVYAQLESDSDTKAFIQAIRDLKASSSEPAAVTACAPPALATQTPVPATGADPTEFQEGVYRTEMSAEELLAVGVEPDTANALDGINTHTYKDGQWLGEIKRDVPDECHGTYAVESGRLVVTLTDCGAPPGGRLLFSATWTFDGTTLILDDVQSGTDKNPQAIWGDREWIRIDEPDAVEPEFPEGVYRTEMSTEDLLAAGVDSGAANAADGINTMTFQNGQFVHDIKRDVPDQCHGTYTVESGRVVVRGTDCGGDGRVRFSATWTFDGRTLILDDLQSETDTQVFAQGLWGGRSWEKFG